MPKGRSLILSGRAIGETLHKELTYCRALSGEPRVPIRSLAAGSPPRLLVTPPAKVGGRFILG